METQESSVPWVRSLAHIQTLAEIPEGPKLVFIFGPGSSARQGLKQTSDAVNGKRRILWHRLDKFGADLSESLATAAGEPVTLLVHGMELVEPKRRQEIAIELNTGRNTLSSFNALIIYWIPENEQEDLFRFCADLLQWRSLVVNVTPEQLESYRLTQTANYDVFLSHSSADKSAVEILARRLREDGLEPFLGKWHLIPGKPWPEELEKALDESRTCAVFVGRDLGPWHNEEMRVALDERVRNAGFRVIPVLLPGTPRPDRKALPRFLKRLSWIDFRSGLEDIEAYHRLLDGIRGVAPGRSVKALAAAYNAKLPPGDFFVPRQELDQVRDLLIRNARSTVEITTALHGADGFGKTALARALCDQPDIREAYPDGILWTTMGRRLHDAGRVDRVLDLARWWTDEAPPGFGSAHDAGDYLRETLAGRCVLVVVDDVWQTADLEPFCGLETGTVLATTRNVRTLPANTQRIDVGPMATSEAMALLAHGLPRVSSRRLSNLAGKLGEWPLLLRLVHSQLLDLVRERGLDVLAALEHVESRLLEVGLRAFDRRDATERAEVLRLTMNISLAALSTENRQRYLDLAVFPEGVDIPIRVVERLWRLEDWEAEDLCLQLADFSLLLDFDVTERTLRVHDTVRHSLVGEHGDLRSLHRRLLARCRTPSGRWTDLADSETYMWRHLAVHLAGADEWAELRRLLFDFNYLEGKMRAAGVYALLSDYDVLGDDGTPRTVQRALRLSAHVLGKDAQELARHLLDQLDQRLPDFEQLLSDAAQHITGVVNGSPRRSCPPREVSDAA